MNVLLLPEAAREFEDAVVYLEGEEPGLGRRFRVELDSHVRWLALNPTIPRLRDGVYRRVNLQVFPYYIAYLIKNETVWILAIAHGHRRPDYWIDRRTPNGHPGGADNPYNPPENPKNQLVD